MARIAEHEAALGKYLYEQLEAVGGLKLYGPSTRQATRTGLVAFNCPAVHATDLSFFLDQEGVAVRTGHHCTQPLHVALGASGSLRASLYFYNDARDVDFCVQALKDTLVMFENMKGE
jgi:cysteine desulfurase/selenocysteine lyase